MAFARLRPFGPRREAHYFGGVVSTLLNQHIDPAKTEPIKHDSIFPTDEAALIPDREPPDPDTLWDKIDRVMRQE